MTDGADRAKFATGSWACAGKTRFDTFRAAERVARRRHRTRDAEGGRQVYRCQQCKGFHIGHRGLRSV